MMRLNKEHLDIYIDELKMFKPRGVEFSIKDSILELKSTGREYFSLKLKLDSEEFNIFSVGELNKIVSFKEFKSTLSKIYSQDVKLEFTSNQLVIKGKKIQYTLGYIEKEELRPLQLPDPTIFTLLQANKIIKEMFYLYGSGFETELNKNVPKGINFKSIMTKKELVSTDKYRMYYKNGESFIDSEEEFSIFIEKQVLDVINNYSIFADDYLYVEYYGHGSYIKLKNSKIEIGYVPKVLKFLGYSHLLLTKPEILATETIEVNSILNSLVEDKYNISSLTFTKQMLSDILELYKDKQLVFKYKDTKSPVYVYEPDLEGNILNHYYLVQPYIGKTSPPESEVVTAIE